MTSEVMGLKASGNKGLVNTIAACLTLSHKEAMQYVKTMGLNQMTSPNLILQPL